LKGVQSKVTVNRLSQSLAVLAYLVSVIVVAGWLTNNFSLIRLYIDWSPMSFNGAICAMLTALAILILPVKPRWACFVSLIPLVIAALTLFEYLFNVNLGFDEFFVADVTMNLYPGRLAPNGALCYLLLNMSILLHLYFPTKFIKFAQLTMAALVFCIAASVVVGYLFNIKIAYGWVGLAAMSIPSSICFLLLSLALIIHFFNCYRRFYSDYGLLQTMLIIIIGTLFFILLWQSFLETVHQQISKKIKDDARLIVNVIELTMHDNYLSSLRFFKRLDKQNLSDQFIKKDIIGYMNDMPDLALVQWSNSEGQVQRVASDYQSEFEPMPWNDLCQNNLSKNRINTTLVASQLANGNPYLCLQYKNKRQVLVLFNMQKTIEMALKKSLVKEVGLIIHYDNNLLFQYKNSEPPRFVSQWAYTGTFNVDFLEKPIVFQAWPSWQFVRDNTPWFSSVSIILGLVVTFLLAFVNYLKQQIAMDNSKLQSTVVAESNKLLEMEHKFKQVYEGAPDMYLFVNQTMQIIECNDTYLENMGFASKENILGRNVFRVLAIQNKLLEKQLQEQIKESGFINNIELSLINQNNAIQRMSLKVSPYIDRNHHLIGYLFSFRDIADIKALEDELTAREYSENLFKENKALYDLVLDETTDGWWDINIETRACYLSPKLLSSLGYEKSSVLADYSFFESHCLPEDFKKIKDNINQHIRSKGVYPLMQEVRYIHSNGAFVWILARGQGIVDPDGKIRRIVGTHVDITALKEAQAKLSEKIRELNLIYNTTNLISSSEDLNTAYERCLTEIGQVAQFSMGVVYRCKEQTNTLVIKASWQNSKESSALTPVNDREYSYGEGLAGLCWHTQQSMWIDAEKYHKQFGNALLFKNDKFKWVLVFPIVSGGEVDAVFEFFASDQLKVTPERSLFDLLATQISSAVERKKSHYLLQHLALHDDLTKLPNRRACMDTLEFTINKEQQFSLMYLDLDGFKAVNDNYGHDIGDLLLIEVSKLFKNKLRSQDYLARLAGDEFLVIVTDMSDEQSLPMLAGRLIASLQKPLVLENNSVQISVSIGIATYPEDGDNIETLLKRADDAMYKAKENGKNNFYMVPRV